MFRRATHTFTPAAASQPRTPPEKTFSRPPLQDNSDICASNTNYDSASTSGSIPEGLTSTVPDGWFEAAKKGNVKKIAQLLQDYQFNINQPDSTHMPIFSDDGNWTALHYAAYCGYTDTVDLLLKHNINIHAKTEKGQTALHLAADNGRPQEVRLLLGGHTKTIRLLLKYRVTVHIKDINGKTAAMLAKNRGFTALAKLIENAEATLTTIPAVLTSPSTGYPPPSSSSSRAPEAWFDAAARGQLDLIQHLWQTHTPKFSIDITDASGATALCKAANSHATETVAFLLGKNANVGHGDNHGFTAIHYAALNCATDTLKLLLKRGALQSFPRHAFFNAQNEDGETALHILARTTARSEKERIKAAQLLLAYGAFTNSPTTSALAREHDNFLFAKYLDDIHTGQIPRPTEADLDTPLVLESQLSAYLCNDISRVASSVTTQEAGTLQGIATSSHDTSVDTHQAHHLFSEQSVDPNSTDECVNTTKTLATKKRLTLLHIAARKSRPDILSISLRTTAVSSINTQDKHGRTPLYYAVESGNVETVDLLLKCGAKIDATDINGDNTALHCAAYFGHKSTVELLLNVYHMDTSTKNKQGETAAMIAARRGHKALAEYLETFEAKQIEAMGPFLLTTVHATATNSRSTLAASSTLSSTNTRASSSTTNIHPTVVESLSTHNQKQFSALLERIEDLLQTYDQAKGFLRRIRGDAPEVIDIRRRLASYQTTMHSLGKQELSGAALLSLINLSHALLTLKPQEGHASHDLIVEIKRLLPSHTLLNQLIALFKKKSIDIFHYPDMFLHYLFENHQDWRSFSNLFNENTISDLGSSEINYLLRGDIAYYPSRLYFVKLLKLIHQENLIIPFLSANDDSFILKMIESATSISMQLDHNHITVDGLLAYLSRLSLITGNVTQENIWHAHVSTHINVDSLSEAAKQNLIEAKLTFNGVSKSEFAAIRQLIQSYNAQDQLLAIDIIAALRDKQIQDLRCIGLLTVDELLLLRPSHHTEFCFKICYILAFMGFSNEIAFFLSEYDETLVNTGITNEKTIWQVLNNIDEHITEIALLSSHVKQEQENISHYNFYIIWNAMVDVAIKLSHPEQNDFQTNGLPLKLNSLRININYLPSISRLVINASQENLLTTINGIFYLHKLFNYEYLAIRKAIAHINNEHAIAYLLLLTESRIEDLNDIEHLAVNHIPINLFQALARQNILTRPIHRLIISFMKLKPNLDVDTWNSNDNMLYLFQLMHRLDYYDVNILINTRMLAVKVKALKIFYAENKLTPIIFSHLFNSTYEKLFDITLITDLGLDNWCNLFSPEIINISIKNISNRDYLNYLILLKLHTYEDFSDPSSLIQGHIPLTLLDDLVKRQCLTIPMHRFIAKYINTDPSSYNFVSSIERVNRLEQMHRLDLYEYDIFCGIFSGLYSNKLITLCEKQNMLNKDTFGIIFLSFELFRQRWVDQFLKHVNDKVDLRKFNFIVVAFMQKQKNPKITSEQMFRYLKHKYDSIGLAKKNVFKKLGIKEQDAVINRAQSSHDPGVDEARVFSVNALYDVYQPNVSSRTSQQRMNAYLTFLRSVTAAEIKSYDKDIDFLTAVKCANDLFRLMTKTFTIRPEQRDAEGNIVPRDPTEDEINHLWVNQQIDTTDGVSPRGITNQILFTMLVCFCFETNERFSGVTERDALISMVLMSYKLLRNYNLNELGQDDGKADDRTCPGGGANIMVNEMSPVFHRINMSVQNHAMASEYLPACVCAHLQKFLMTMVCENSIEAKKVILMLQDKGNILPVWPNIKSAVEKELREKFPALYGKQVRNGEKTGAAHLHDLLIGTEYVPIDNVLYACETALRQQTSSSSSHTASSSASRSSDDASGSSRSASSSHYAGSTSTFFANPPTKTTYQHSTPLSGSSFNHAPSRVHSSVPKAAQSSPISLFADEDTLFDRQETYAPAPLTNRSSSSESLFDF